MKRWADTVPSLQWTNICRKQLAIHGTWDWSPFRNTVSDFARTGKVNGDQWLSDGIGLLALGRKNKGVCFVLLSFFCNFAH